MPSLDPSSHFATTHWSVVLGAAAGESSRSKAALAELCATYFRPIFAFARRSGNNFHDAQDLSQGFFEHLLESGLIRAAAPDQGRFRSFLLRSFQLYSQREWIKGRALKRGGGELPVSFEQLSEFDHENLIATGELASPTVVFDRQWAGELYAQAFKRLQAHYESTHRGELYRTLKPFMDTPGNAEAYAKIADSLGVDPGAIATRVSRMRDRFFEFVRLEVEKTVEKPELVEEELRYLLEVLAST